MSIREPDFAGDIALTLKKFPFYKTVANPVPPAQAKAELATIVAALNTDTTKHDKTIEAPPAALRINSNTQTQFTNAINLIVNKGKAGNLSTSQMIAGIDSAVGVPFKPAIVQVPFAHANATPPIVGTVCTCTQGQWVGTPTSYAYAWSRDGTPIGGATAATYTLVSADVGGHSLTCIVTATNAQGSTVGPPSNVIAT